MVSTLAFNSKGLLVSDSYISISLVDFESTFVTDFPTSKTRQKIYENYIAYSDELKKLLNLSDIKQWVDGSYVTKVINPKDIDFVTFIDEKIFLKYQNDLDSFKNKNWFDLNIDAYFVIEKEGHCFESDKLYWLHHFSKTRNNSRTGKRLKKGFVEINH